VGVTLSVTSTLARRALTVRHVVAMLGVAYGVFHYVVQGKGWDYHLYPLVAFAAVARFAELEAALAWRPLAVGVPLVACCLTAAALLGARGIDAVPMYFASAKITHVRYVVGGSRPDHAARRSRPGARHDRGWRARAAGARPASADAVSV